MKRTYETAGFMIGGAVGMALTVLLMKLVGSAFAYMLVLLGAMLGGIVGVRIPKKDRK